MEVKKTVQLIDWNLQDQAISMIAAYKKIEATEDLDQRVELSVKY
jgi:hypothetical protein